MGKQYRGSHSNLESKESGIWQNWVLYGAGSVIMYEPAYSEISQDIQNEVYARAEHLYRRTKVGINVEDISILRGTGSRSVLGELNVECKSKDNHQMRLSQMEYNVYHCRNILGAYSQTRIAVTIRLEHTYNKT